MPHLPRIGSLGFLVALLLGFVAARAAVPRIHEEGGAGRTVVVAPIEGTIDPGIAAYVRRVVTGERDAAAIVFVMDTFGGRVDSAVQIRDVLLEADVPTVVYVDHRAISAGALVTYAADTIVFAPGATMGAATPIQLVGGEAEAVDEKFVSYMRAEMRATAEAKGRRGDIAEAMVDRTLAVEGIDAEGQLLTVTTAQALEMGLADGTADSLDALLEALGLEDADRVSASPGWAEQLARFVTDPAVAGILMSIGMLGLAVELYTPGLGFTGIFGIGCLALFFGGHLVADLAGWEEAALLLAGVVCVAAEIFWIPGFGVAGIAGIVMIAGGLVLSLVGMPLDQSWELGIVGAALQRVLWSSLATVVGLGLIVAFVPARAFPRWLVLRTESGRAAREPDELLTDVAAGRAHPEQGHLLGLRGEALTDLRPSGNARIGDRVVDVVSRYDYLPRGTPVVVIEVEGMRVVVDRPPPSV